MKTDNIKIKAIKSDLVLHMHYYNYAKLLLTIL